MKFPPLKQLLIGLALVLGLGFIILLSLRFVEREDRSASFQLREPLPQDPFIQVYFNHSAAAQYTEPYRGITRRGDDLEQRIVDAINNAQTTLDVAVQELRLPKIAQAVGDRYRAGVRVRVIIENTYNNSLALLSPAEVERLEERERERYAEAMQLVDLNQDGQASQQELDQRDALVILNNAGVPLIDDTADGSKGSGLMHHKFVVIDGQTVVTGSANFTTSGIHGDFLAPETRGNANHILVIESPRLAERFTEEFNLMWGDGPGGEADSKFGLQKKPSRPAQQVTVGSTSMVVMFSPFSRSESWEQTTNGLIGQSLDLAAQSVDLALFVFSEQPLVDILRSRHQQGVTIRALIDPSFAYREYSEGLDMMGLELAGRNCKLEAGNRPWASPIDTVGIPNLPRGDKLHHKFGVVDDEIVITGSHNWSASANHSNDETLLVIDNNSTVAAHFEREFEQLYADAFLGVPPGIQNKLDDRKRQCDLQ